jgi:hypothetical protein
MRISFQWLLVIALAAGARLAADRPEVDDEKLLQRAHVGTSDRELLGFLQRRTLNDVDHERIKTLIRQLGDDSFEVREKASAALVAVGSAAEGLLRDAAGNSDVEVVRRAEECLRALRRGDSAAAPAAAVRLIGRRKPAGAAAVLLGYLPFADNEAVAEELRGALAAVAVRDGKPDPGVVAALADKVPARRAAAAEALFRAGAAEPEQVRKLLDDPDPAVRLQLALAMVYARQKDAIPRLIDLVGRLPADQGWQAEWVLSHVAGSSAPAAPTGDGPADREKSRAAWSLWWRENGGDLDPARLSDLPRWRGYTLLMQLDAGRAFEVDRQGRVLWQVEGLQFPLDIQFLPDVNRILVAEHSGNRVAEYDLSGRTVWSKPFESPLVAQRLPNGNTFIVSHTQMVEITRQGKEVFSFTPPDGDSLMKAQKLPNGHIAYVQTGRFVEVDAAGKRLRSFPVNVHTSGGRIDVLPNGNVLVPEHRANRLVEYSPEGKELWVAPVEQPIAAVRLPNGNSLVTSMIQMRAIELDRRGKECWHYQSDTRLTRAYRR